MLINNANITGSLAVVGTTVLSGSLAVSTLSGSGVRYLVSDGAGNMTAQTASAAIKNAQAYTASAGQTVFPVTNGYTTNLVDVYINGSKLLDGLEYNDTSGTNIVLTTGSFAGDIVEIVTYQPASGVTNNSLRTLTSFTATAGQTTFSASYVPGLLDVYYNGSRLNTVDYTAANGNSIILTTGSNTGDIVDVLVYSYQVGAFSGIGGTGTANQIAYWNTTNSITGSSNFTFNGSALTITGSFAVFTGSAAEFTVNQTGVNLGSALTDSHTITGSVNITGSLTVVTTGTEFQVTSTGTNFGNALTDSHVISGSLRVNPSGLFVSSSGVVGIGTVSPTSSLDVRVAVESPATGKVALAVGTSNGANDIFRWYDGTTQLGVFKNSGDISIGTTSTNSNTKVKIKASSEGSAIGLSSSTLCIARSATDTFLSIGYYSTPDAFLISTSYGADGAYKPIAFATSDTERMKIYSNGNISVGTNIVDSGFKFYMRSTAGMYLETGNGSSSTSFQINDVTGGTVYFRVRGDGYLQSATTYNNTTASPNYLSISTSGFFERYVSSSQRYKEEIKDWDVNGLDIILALRPRTYKYKKEYYNKADVDFLGLIAEEVAEVNTYLADYENEDRTGLVENVRYANIVVPLIKALQEANAKITALEEKLERNNIQ
jgi:hypothetical protein